MLDWFRYRYQLSKLQAKKRREVRACLQGWPKGEELKALSYKDMEALRDPVVAIEEDIAKLLTSYLCSEAQKLFLPVSNVDDDWEWSKIRRHYCLTNAAMVKLRSAIRAEKKEGSENFRSWLGSITGIIGILLASLAIILGRR